MDFTFTLKDNFESYQPIITLNFHKAQIRVAFKKRLIEQNISKFVKYRFLEDFVMYFDMLNI
jgi:hypothetical protein